MTGVPDREKPTPTPAAGLSAAAPAAARVSSRPGDSGLEMSGYRRTKANRYRWPGHPPTLVRLVLLVELA